MSIAAAVEAARAATRVYGPDPVEISQVSPVGMLFEVTGESSLEAARLGAWGCGVFRNDPAQVAGAFHGLLGPGGRFAGHFEHVVFGVLDRTPGTATRGAFERAFDGEVRGAQRQP
ncbi:TIGR02452 family protein [Streptomyces avermitilis]|uniref:TIGR02452 family protein n=1 Tax=Streptomyces avermitilis TaxID=33903 RepID=UPI003F4C773A